MISSCSPARARLVSLDAILIERDQTIITIMDQLAVAQEEAAMAQARVLSLQSEREGLGEVIVELRQQIFVLQGTQDEWQTERDTLVREHDATLASLEAARVTINGLNLQIGENGAERDRLNRSLTHRALFTARFTRRCLGVAPRAG